MKFPEEVRQALVRRYRNQHQTWLLGDGQWPVTLSLGCPDEREAERQSSAARAWIAAWREWCGAGELVWREKRWRTLGTQRIPEALMLKCPEDIAAWIGESGRWMKAQESYRQFTARWPSLAPHLPRHFDVLADYTDLDLRRFETLLTWLEANPHSNLYPRQLPIAGIDTKWMEARKSLITDVIGALQAPTMHSEVSSTLDFYSRCGLRSPPPLVRMLILDRSLRAQVGGLRDISAPPDQLAELILSARRVLIIENLQTGLAFNDLKESVVFMRMGYAVDVLGRIPWVKNCECLYWGDIDTHGFAILNRTRVHIPHAKSILMDEETLLKYRDFWSAEHEQHAAQQLPLLTAAEANLYHRLKTHFWGMNVRLEQERIDWSDSWGVVRHQCDD